MIIRDRIEYYGTDDKLIAVANSSMVPPVSSKISIRKQTWEVVNITYALDYADEHYSSMRANIDLRILGSNDE